MEKIKINLDIGLPGVPDEKDACLQHIITAMESKKGVDKAYIVPETQTSKAQLCLHPIPKKFL